DLPLDLPVQIGHGAVELREEARLFGATPRLPHGEAEHGGRGDGEDRGGGDQALGEGHVEGVTWRGRFGEVTRRGGPTQGELEASSRSPRAPWGSRRTPAATPSDPRPPTLWATTPDGLRGTAGCRRSAPPPPEWVPRRPSETERGTPARPPASRSAPSAPRRPARGRPGSRWRAGGRWRPARSERAGPRERPPGHGLARPPDRRDPAGAARRPTARTPSRGAPRRRCPGGRALGGTG